MSTKPSKVPSWNTGKANNVEPTAGEKVTGWTVGQVPPSSYFNWLLELIGEWCQYLSDAVFTGGVTVDVLTAARTSAGAAITATATNGSAVSGTGGGTGNAGVTGTGSATGLGSPGVQGNGAGVYPGVLGTGGPNAAGVSGIPGTGGTVGVDCQGHLDFSSAPATLSNTKVSNRLSKELMPKACGLVQLAAGVGSVLNGANIDSVATSPLDSTQMRITLTTDAGGDVACVITQRGGSAPRFFDVLNQGSSGGKRWLDIRAWDLAGANVDMSAGTHVLSFIVTGPLA